MKYSDFLMDLKEGNPSSFYLISLEDPIFLKELILKVKPLFFPKKENPFDFSLFSAESHPLSQIMEQTLILPVLSRRRLIILKDAEKLKDPDRKKLFSFLKTIPKSSCFLIIFPRAVRLPLPSSTVRVSSSDLSLKSERKSGPFEIVDLLMRGDMGKAILSLDRSLVREKDFSSMTGILTYYLRSQAKKRRKIDYSLISKFNSLQKIDKKIKNGLLPPRIGMELALLSIQD